MEQKKKRVKPAGSGRKKGEETKRIRVPLSKLPAVEQVIAGNVPVKMKTPKL
jgi:hypothetical protein